MSTTMADIAKEDVIELQRPTGGKRSPESDEALGNGHSELSQDTADMHRLGRAQQLKRNFHPLSTLGLTTIIMGTWGSMIASSEFCLVDGGRAGMIWLFIITFIFQIAVVASMAEMASIAPTSAGQYHWVSEFAPPSYQQFLSYISGWLSALGWQANIAANAYSCGQFALILASLNGKFEPTPWQGCVLTMATVLFCAAFNVWAAKWLPLLEGVILFFNIMGLFAVCIPLWVLGPKAPSNEVWTSFSNGGNWASAGAATIIGFITTAAAFIGSDSAAHMSEEVQNASLIVPRVMLSAVILNGIMALVVTITFVYSIQDVEQQIINSPYAFSFIGIFATSTNSTAGAIGMTIPWLVLSAAGCMNSVAAGSRQAWAFARDGGLPWSPWFQKVKVVHEVPIPINSILGSLTITVVLSLIVLGSTEAFNSIVGLVGAAIEFSYSISIGCILWRRLFGAPLPHARWSLGRWGVPLNMAGCLFEAFATVISFFPLTSAVTPANMNWSSAMFGGVALLSSIYYIVHGRKAYTGPVMYIKRD